VLAYYQPAIDFYTVRQMMKVSGADQIKVIGNFLNLPFTYADGWFKGYSAYVLEPNGFYHEDFLRGFRDGRDFRIVWPPYSES
jgi:hypothetical protein